MKLIYIDNQTLIYLFENGHQKEIAGFEALSEQHNLKPAFSLNNLIEICQSPTKAQALNLAMAIDALNGLWLDWYLDVQKGELMKFLSESFFRTSSTYYSPIRTSLSELFDIDEKTLRLNFTAKMFVEMTYNSTHMPEFRIKHSEHASVLEQLQEHRKKGNLTKRIDRITFNNFIVSRIPDYSPWQTLLSPQDKREIIRYCLERKGSLLESCPSIACEEHLSNFRTSNPNRKAQPSDSEDLLFSCVALPYVDFLITNDAYLKNGLEYVKRRLAQIQCKILRRFSDTMENNN